MGTMSGVGHFERRLMTADPTYRADLITRNNAIEDMYRRGYDRSQIDAYLKGDASALASGPSFQSYYDAIDAGQTDFANQYFIGSPGYTGQAPAAQNSGSNTGNGFQRVGYFGLDVSGQQRAPYDPTLPSGGPNQQMSAFPSKGGNTPTYGIPSKGGYSSGYRTQFGPNKGGMP